MANFPSVIATFPIVAPTDRLNSPSHSALHNSVSSVLTQVQTIIGVEGANSVVGSLEYLIKSPDSDGGGHVQSANKGGTGQTTYTKGDMLIATSSSVLSKMAISSTAGEVLVVDPSQATGLKYAAVVANKVKTSITSATISNSSALTVLYSASILGSTLGTNNAIRFTGEIQKFISDGVNQWTFITNYGNTIIASFVGSPTIGSPITQVQQGRLTGMIVGGGTTTTQRAIMEFQTSYPGGDKMTTQSVLSYFTSGGALEDSSANQTLSITAKTNYNGSGTVSILTGLFVVEKIV